MEGKHDDTMRALQVGARGYLTKPFKPVDLHALIDRVVTAPASPRGHAAVS